MMWYSSGSLMDNLKQQHRTIMMTIERNVSSEMSSFLWLLRSMHSLDLRSDILSLLEVYFSYARITNVAFTVSVSDHPFYVRNLNCSQRVLEEILECVWLGSRPAVLRHRLSWLCMIRAYRRLSLPNWVGHVTKMVLDFLDLLDFLDCDYSSHLSSSSSSSHEVNGIRQAWYNTRKFSVSSICIRRVPMHGILLKHTARYV